VPDLDGVLVGVLDDLDGDLPLRDLAHPEDRVGRRALHHRRRAPVDGGRSI
jgi:hypothetical protein